MTNSSHVASNTTQALELTVEVQYDPLRYTTPSEKRYGICKNASIRWAKAAEDAAEHDIKVSLMSLGTLWDWALDQAMAGSIFSKGRPKNEKELDAAIEGSLQTSLCAMSAEVQADFKKWQMETHPNARYSTPSMRHKFVPAPYDLTVMRFPVDGWQSNPSRTRRGSGDQALRMTKYRYYGFRMVLGTEALDVGSVIKASTYKCQDDAHSPRSKRRSARQWLRDQAAVVRGNLRYRSLGFDREVDKFLQSDQVTSEDPSSSMDEQESEIGRGEGFSPWTRSSFSRPSSTATTCIPTSPLSATNSTHTLPETSFTRRCNIENASLRFGQRHFTARSSFADSRTLNERASLRPTTTLDEPTVLHAISYIKAKKKWAEASGLAWNAPLF